MSAQHWLIVDNDDGELGAEVECPHGYGDHTERHECTTIWFTEGKSTLGGCRIHFEAEQSGLDYLLHANPHRGRAWMEDVLREVGIAAPGRYPVRLEEEGSGEDFRCWLIVESA